MQLLERFDWPGNVRQLINAMERGKILSDDQTLLVHDLPQEIVTADSSNGRVDAASNAALATIERAHILEVLQKEGGNKARTARVLGVNWRSLYRLIDKFSISPAEISGLSP